MNGLGLYNKVVGAAFALVFLCLADVMPAVAVVPEWDPRLERGTLENGLSYVIYDSEKAEDPFNIRLIVHAGSVDEDEPSGVAHILEHMVFQSTDAHPESIHRYLQSIGWRTGLQVNAVTRETETQYMVRTRPQDALDLNGSLTLLADIAFGARLVEDDWNRERGVILQELRQGDSVADRLSRQKKEILRIGSRYVDRPTIGTVEGIERTTVTDIRAFRDKYYVASNMTLILSGNINKRQAVEAITRHFGKAPAKPAPDRSYVKLLLADGLRVGTVQEPQGSSSQVTYALRLAMLDRRTEDGQFAYLQNYFLARLIRDEVERYAADYQGQAKVLTFVSQESTDERLIMAFNARTLKHGEAWPALLEVVERLRRNGLSAAGFEQLMLSAQRSNLRNPVASEARTFADWEDKITSALLINSVLEAPATKTARLEEMLKRISLDGLNARLRDMLAARDRVLFYQLAGGDTQPLPTVDEIVREEDRLASLERLASRPKVVAAVSPAQKASTPELPENLGLRHDGRIVSEVSKPHQNITEWRLSNQDRVIWLAQDTPDGKAYISAQTRTGYMNAGFDSVLSQAAVQLWHQSGFNFWSQDEFDRWNDARKARWSWALKQGGLDVAVAARPDELADLLRAYAMSVEFGTVREEALAAFRESYTASRHSDDFAAVLYGEKQNELTPELLEKITTQDLRNVGKQFLRAPADWFVVGPAPDTAVKQVFSAEIAGIDREETLTPKPLRQRDGFHAVEIETFKADRAKVTMSFFEDMNWTPEGAFVTSALTPLAQQALKNRLRLELGGVYSVQFELNMDPETNRIIGRLSFNCDPSRVEELTGAAISALKNMPHVAKEADGARLEADIRFAEETRLSDPNTSLRRLALSYKRYGDAGYLDRVRHLPEKITPDLLSKHAEHVFAMTNVAILKQMPE